MLVRFDPFREVDRLMGQLSPAGRGAPMGVPMDAIRRGDRFMIWLDLPGVDGDAIDLTVDRNVLTVRAERRYPPGEDDQILVSERPQGEFRRELILGDTLDTERVEATYRNGVLELTIPVAEQAKPRRVQVTGGDGAGRVVEGTARESGGEGGGSG